MDKLSPDVITQLCELSDDDINQTDPSELHKVLIMAIEQIEEDLVSLGIDYNVLRFSNQRLELQAKVKQLSVLDAQLDLVNSKGG